MEARTYLFVPGNRPERFAKALGSGADAIVLDLEDAVAPSSKVEAREAIARWAAGLQSVEARSRIVVRANEAGTPAFDADMRLLRAAALPAVMLPKAESAAQVRAVQEALPGAQVLALIETARGVVAAHEVAANPAVQRLVFGTLDYALDLDLDIAEHADGLAHAASVIAIASRVAGLPPPVAGVTPQLDDVARLQADVAWARRHGFAAKLCIHPRQVAAVHDALAPSPAALDRARRVLAADAASPGAAQLEGRMVDRPVVLQARRTLQRAGA
jgi:citrate lyase subunit beta/citryl-CoA lyase